eukprot:IDg6941t1
MHDGTEMLAKIVIREKKRDMICAMVCELWYECSREGNSYHRMRCCPSSQLRLSACYSLNDSPTLRLRVVLTQPAPRLLPYVARPKHILRGTFSKYSESTEQELISKPVFQCDTDDVTKIKKEL